VNNCSKCENNTKPTLLKHENGNERARRKKGILHKSLKNFVKGNYGYLGSKATGKSYKKIFQQTYTGPYKVLEKMSPVSPKLGFKMNGYNNAIFHNRHHKKAYVY
jgi:hypothetical protein